MLGIILCGGLSTRMGNDKGLLKLHAKTWAQTAIDKVSELQIPVVISINRYQYPGYSSIFPQSQFVPDNETLKIKGPLCAVLSVHLQYRNEDFIILACDMPLMETDILKELMTHYRQDPGDAFVFANDGEPEPLCGIYKASGLSHILHLSETGQLPRFSMKSM